MKKKNAINTPKPAQRKYHNGLLTLKDQSTKADTYLL